MKGDFVFLFDGFDEIPLDERKSVTSQIQSFVEKAGGNNLFLLSSRPEDALSSFGDFKEFKIKPLSLEEAYTLINKYDDFGKVSKLLIKKLKEQQYRNVQEFLTNPLLASLLFAAFEYKQIIPLKKHIFYRQVYDALFESHDLTKGDSFVRDKFSKLDIDDFHRVLRHIGYNCIVKGKIEFTKDEILPLINEAKKFTKGLAFKESDFLRDMLNTVPLFLKDGIYYKWSHKSLQEYFAAQFIFLDARSQQENILLKLYKHDDSEKFRNVLDIYYSIDYKSFCETIIYDLLKDFIGYLQNSYKGISNSGKEDRQKMTFSCGFGIAFESAKIDDLGWMWEVIEKLEGNERKYYLYAGPSFKEFQANNMAVIVNETYRQKILEFLFKKKEKFVQIENADQKVKFIKPLQHKKLYFIDDDKNSPLNSLENFQMVTGLLPLAIPNLYTIDIEKGKKMLSILEAGLNAKTRSKLLDF